MQKVIATPPPTLAPTPAPSTVTSRGSLEETGKNPGRHGASRHFLLSPNPRPTLLPGLAGGRGGEGEGERRKEGENKEGKNREEVRRRKGRGRWWKKGKVNERKRGRKGEREGW